MGFSIGRVIFLNCCQRFAPSTRAASYSSCGIDCNPPSAITIINGNPNQMFVNMQAVNASKGWLSHAIAGRLKYLVIAKLIAPYSWLNIPRQLSAPIYWGNAQGIINNVRIMGLAGRVRFIRTAKKIPSDT